MNNKEEIYNLNNSIYYKYIDNFLNFYLKIVYKNIKLSKIIMTINK